MPTIHKLMQFRTSYGIILPMAWLKNVERKKGKKVVAIEIEDGENLTIKPVFENLDKT